MEELHSSAGLDEQIYAEARKKAAKILAKADSDSAVLLDGVAARVLDAKTKAEDASQSRISVYEKNIDSSLPLEKQRYRVSYIHDSVVSQIESYIESLSEEKQLEIIQTLVERAKPILKDKKVTAEVVNFNIDEAKKMLVSVLGSNVEKCEEAKPIILEDEKVTGIKTRKGIFVKTDDGKITCRFTLDEKIKEILDSKMEELSSSLFGGRIPE